MYGYARTMIRTMMQQNVKTIEKSKQTGNTMGLGVRCPAVCWAAKSPPPVASLTPRHPPGRQPGPRSSLQAVGTDHLLFETKPGFCHEAFEVFGRILEGFEQEMFILSNMCGQNLWKSQSGLLRAELGRHCFCNVGTDLFFQRAIWIENWETHSAMTILSAILHGQTSVAERALNLKQICQEH